MKQTVIIPLAANIPCTHRVMSDSDLIEGVLLGDSDAGQALVDRFGPIIDRIVWRLMGGDSEHRDIVQQVFQQLVSTLSQLSDAQALAAWVNKVTVNVVRKEFRRRKIRRIIELSETFTEGPIDEAAGRNDTEQCFLLLRAFHILERMNVEDRIAFTLRFVDGMSLEDVAASLGCSLATAKRRVKQGRETFMKRAQKDPFLLSLIKEDVAL